MSQVDFNDSVGVCIILYPRIVDYLYRRNILGIQAAQLTFVPHLTIVDIYICNSPSKDRIAAIAT